MKKLLFLLSFVMVAGMANAQSCNKKGKKCCAKKAGATTSMTQAGNMTNLTAEATATADMFAEKDESIEKRVCEKSGKACFYQKAVCEKSGKVSWNEVSFCEKSQAFKAVAAATEEEMPIKEINANPSSGGI